tara:strand:- start:251 stop:1093 length:843 start_codon:yes stop_codon:yes gene_type:complete
MAKQLQLRRGTTAEHASFTGAVGEVTIDADKDTAVVHDAYQAGGFPLLREDLNNLANASITAAKMATNSGTYGQTLQVNDAGTAIEMGESGPVSCQFFTSSGTWTKPAGIKYVRVEVIGGGGGGSGHAESGGAGGYTARIMDVRALTTVTVTVGGGGTGVTYASGGGNGGVSSFGSYATGNGGYGGNQNAGHSGGFGGGSSGGQVQIVGGGGNGHDPATGGQGGGGYFGNGSAGGHATSGNFPGSFDGQGARGGGGAGGYGTSSRGAQGTPGCVIVWEYA